MHNYDQWPACNVRAQYQFLYYDVFAIEGRKPEMNISFCGCGFLGVYQLGVLKALQTLAPQFLASVHRVGGASAGSLVGAIMVCEPDKVDVSKRKLLYIIPDNRQCCGFLLIDT